MSAPRCPGTGHRTGGFPGDQDICPVCERWITVNRDTGLRKHTISAQRLAQWEQRRSLGTNLRRLWDVRGES